MWLRICLDRIRRHACRNSIKKPLAIFTPIWLLWPTLRHCFAVILCTAKVEGGQMPSQSGSKICPETAISQETCEFIFPLTWPPTITIPANFKPNLTFRLPPTKYLTWPVLRLVSSNNYMDTRCQGSLEMVFLRRGAWGELWRSCNCGARHICLFPFKLRTRRCSNGAPCAFPFLG